MSTIKKRFETFEEMVETLGGTKVVVLDKTAGKDVYSVASDVDTVILNGSVPSKAIIAEKDANASSNLTIKAYAGSGSVALAGGARLGNSDDAISSVLLSIADDARVTTVTAAYAEYNKDTALNSGLVKTLSIQNASIGVHGGTVTDLFGGGINTENSNSKKYILGAKIVVDNANVEVFSGTVSNVYGGGVGTNNFTNQATVTLNAGTVGTVYGGGKNGAAVKDVNIVVDAGSTAGNAALKISNIYAGGNNANVYGDVNVTFTTQGGNGANTLNFSGVVSGAGVGTGVVNGNRTLDFADYQGDFNATIQNFREIVFSGDTAVNLTKAQHASVKYADYVFELNQDSNVINTTSLAGGNQKAMLTWNNTAVTYNNVSVVVDSELLDAGSFSANLIYNRNYKNFNSSNFSTDSVTVFGNKVVSNMTEDGVLVSSEVKYIIADYQYEVAFAKSLDSKGNEYENGMLAFKYVGGELNLDASGYSKNVLNGADDFVNFVKGENGNIMTYNFDAAGGDDTITVDQGVRFVGKLATGAGNDVVQINGHVDKLSLGKGNNDIYINGNGANLATGAVLAVDPYQVGSVNTVFADKESNNDFYISGAIGTYETKTTPTAHTTVDRVITTPRYDVDGKFVGYDSIKVAVNTTGETYTVTEITYDKNGKETGKKVTETANVSEVVPGYFDDTVAYEFKVGDLTIANGSNTVTLKNGAQVGAITLGGTYGAVAIYAGSKYGAINLADVKDSELKLYTDVSGVADLKYTGSKVLGGSNTISVYASQTLDAVKLDLKGSDTTLHVARGVTATFAAALSDVDLTYDLENNAFVAFTAEKEVIVGDYKGVLDTANVAGITNATKFTSLNALINTSMKVATATTELSFKNLSDTSITLAAAAYNMTVSGIVDNGSVIDASITGATLNLTLDASEFNGAVIGSANADTVTVNAGMIGADAKIALGAGDDTLNVNGDVEIASAIDFGAGDNDVNMNKGNVTVTTAGEVFLKGAGVADKINLNLTDAILDVKKGASLTVDSISFEGNSGITGEGDYNITNAINVKKGQFTLNAQEGTIANYAKIAFNVGDNANNTGATLRVDDGVSAVVKTATFDAGTGTSVLSLGSGAKIAAVPGGAEAGKSDMMKFVNLNVKTELDKGKTPGTLANGTVDTNLVADAAATLMLDHSDVSKSVYFQNTGSVTTAGDIEIGKTLKSVGALTLDASKGSLTVVEDIVAQAGIAALTGTVSAENVKVTGTVAVNGIANVTAKDISATGDITLNAVAVPNGEYPWDGPKVSEVVFNADTMTANVKGTADANNVTFEKATTFLGNIDLSQGGKDTITAKAMKDDVLAGIAVTGEVKFNNLTIDGKVSSTMGFAGTADNDVLKLENNAQLVGNIDFDAATGTDDLNAGEGSKISGSVTYEKLRVSGNLDADSLVSKATKATELNLIYSTVTGEIIGNNQINKIGGDGTLNSTVDFSQGAADEVLGDSNLTLANGADFKFNSLVIGNGSTVTFNAAEVGVAGKFLGTVGNDTLDLGKNSMITGAIDFGTGVDTLKFADANIAADENYTEVTGGISFEEDLTMDTVGGVTADIKGNDAANTVKVDEDVVVKGAFALGKSEDDNIVPDPFDKINVADMKTFTVEDGITFAQNLELTGTGKIKADITKVTAEGDVDKAQLKVTAATTVEGDIALGADALLTLDANLTAQHQEIIALVPTIVRNTVSATELEIVGGAKTLTADVAANVTMNAETGDTNTLTIDGNVNGDIDFAGLGTVTLTVNNVVGNIMLNAATNNLTITGTVTGALDVYNVYTVNVKIAGDFTALDITIHDGATGNAIYEVGGNVTQDPNFGAGNDTLKVAGNITIADLNFREGNNTLEFIAKAVPPAALPDEVTANKITFGTGADTLNIAADKAVTTGAIDFGTTRVNADGSVVVSDDIMTVDATSSLTTADGISFRKLAVTGGVVNANFTGHDAEKSGAAVIAYTNEWFNGNLGPWVDSGAAGASAKWVDQLDLTNTTVNGVISMGKGADAVGISGNVTAGTIDFGTSNDGATIGKDTLALADSSVLTLDNNEKVVKFADNLVVASTGVTSGKIVYDNTADPAGNPIGNLAGQEINDVVKVAVQGGVVPVGATSYTTDNFKVTFNNPDDIVANAEVAVELKDDSEFGTVIKGTDAANSLAFTGITEIDGNVDTGAGNDSVGIDGSVTLKALNADDIAIDYRHTTPDGDPATAKDAAIIGTGVLKMNAGNNKVSFATGSELTAEAIKSDSLLTLGTYNADGSMNTLDAAASITVDDVFLKNNGSKLTLENITIYNTYDIEINGTVDVSGTKNSVHGGITFTGSTLNFNTEITYTDAVPGGAVAQANVTLDSKLVGDITLGAGVLNIGNTLVKVGTENAAGLVGTDRAELEGDITGSDDVAVVDTVNASGKLKVTGSLSKVEALNLTAAADLEITDVSTVSNLTVTGAAGSKLDADFNGANVEAVGKIVWHAVAANDPNPGDPALTAAEAKAAFVASGKASPVGERGYGTVTTRQADSVTLNGVALTGDIDLGNGSEYVADVDTVTIQGASSVSGTITLKGSLNNGLADADLETDFVAKDAVLDVSAAGASLTLGTLAGENITVNGDITVTMITADKVTFNGSVADANGNINATGKDIALGVVTTVTGTITAKTLTLSNNVTANGYALSSGIVAKDSLTLTTSALTVPTPAPVLPADTKSVTSADLALANLNVASGELFTVLQTTQNWKAEAVVPATNPVSYKWVVDGAATTAQGTIVAASGLNLQGAVNANINGNVKLDDFDDMAVNGVTAKVEGTVTGTLTGTAQADDVTLVRVTGAVDMGAGDDTMTVLGTVAAVDMGADIDTLIFGNGQQVTGTNRVTVAAAVTNTEKVKVTANTTATVASLDASLTDLTLGANAILNSTATTGAFGASKLIFNGTDANVLNVGAGAAIQQGSVAVTSVEFNGDLNFTGDLNAVNFKATESGATQILTLADNAKIGELSKEAAVTALNIAGAATTAATIKELKSSATVSGGKVTITKFDTNDVTLTLGSNDADVAITTFTQGANRVVTVASGVTAKANVGTYQITGAFTESTATANMTVGKYEVATAMSSAITFDATVGVDLTYKANNTGAVSFTATPASGSTGLAQSLTLANGVTSGNVTFSADSAVTNAKLTFVSGDNTITSITVGTVANADKYVFDLKGITTDSIATELTTGWLASVTDYQSGSFNIELAAGAQSFANIGTGFELWNGTLTGAAAGETVGLKLGSNDVTLTYVTDGGVNKFTSAAAGSNGWSLDNDGVLKYGIIA